MKIVVFEKFVAVWGTPKAPRGMPEAVAMDPESISPNGGMATPFSPDLMFLGLGFGLARRPWNQRPKNQIWLERGRQTSPRAHINSPDSWGLPLPLDSPWAQKGTNIALFFVVFLNFQHWDFFAQDLNPTLFEDQASTAFCATPQRM